MWLTCYTTHKLENLETAWSYYNDMVTEWIYSIHHDIIAKSNFQKGKTSLDLNEARDDEVSG